MGIKEGTSKINVFSKAHINRSAIIFTKNAFFSREEVEDKPNKNNND